MNDYYKDDKFIFFDACTSIFDDSEEMQKFSATLKIGRILKVWIHKHFYKKYGDPWYIARKKLVEDEKDRKEHLNFVYEMLQY